jgi:hypothetical protein
MRMRVIALVPLLLAAVAMSTPAAAATAPPTRSPHDLFGPTELFTFVSVVTVSLRGRTAQVDVTFPGDITAGGYPHQPVLRDNSFHIHVDCDHALFAVVTLNGSLRTGSPGVTTGAHVSGSGKYVVGFGQDISTCAPGGDGARRVRARRGSRLRRTWPWDRTVARSACGSIGEAPPRWTGSSTSS